MNNTYPDVILKNNDLEYLVIQTADPARPLCYAEHLNVVLHTKDHKKYIIKSAQYEILGFLQDFPEHIKQLLAGKRDIDRDTAQDLGLKAAQAGFLYDQEVEPEKNRPLVYKLESYNITFNGHTNHVWLYRLDGIAYLELTPRPPRTYDVDPALIPALYHTYKKQYRVLVRWQIPLDVLQAWQTQLVKLEKESIKLFLFDHSKCNEHPPRPLDTLDVCQYHDPAYGTDPEAQQDFLRALDMLR